LSERSNALIGQFELEKFRNVKCGVLSSGEQTRVALAKAMLKAFRCPMSTTKLLLGVVPRRGDS
jgi:ABC-type nitrate/sulfonate/bicarbonate transport system ATPase subunit